MTERNIGPSTIAEEVALLRSALDGPDRGRVYLQDINDMMQDGAEGVDSVRLKSVYDLLLRNVVNAADVIGDEALQHAVGRLSCEETALYGDALLGLSAPFNEESAVQKLKHLQVSMNQPLVELDVEVSHIVGRQLLGALMDINTRLLVNGDVRERITRSRSLDYYISHIVLAQKKLNT